MIRHRGAEQESPNQTLDGLRREDHTSLFTRRLIERKLCMFHEKKKNPENTQLPQLPVVQFCGSGSEENEDDDVDENPKRQSPATLTSPPIVNTTSMLRGSTAFSGGASNFSTSLQQHQARRRQIRLDPISPPLSPSKSTSTTRLEFIEKTKSGVTKTPPSVERKVETPSPFAKSVSCTNRPPPSPLREGSTPISSSLLSSSAAMLLTTSSTNCSPMNDSVRSAKPPIPPSSSTSPAPFRETRKLATGPFPFRRSESFEDILRRGEQATVSPNTPSPVLASPAQSEPTLPLVQSISRQNSFGQQNGVRGPVAVESARACYAFFPAPKHISASPKVSEPFHIQRPGLVEEAMSRDLRRFNLELPSRNRVVYDCFDPPPYRNGATAIVDAATGYPFPYYVPANKDDDTLVFESRFESGNLRRAVQVTSVEYDLVLRTDVYTNSYTQWYYFAVSNMRPETDYLFNIGNLYKSEGQYNTGLRPLLYSTIASTRNGEGWVRTGSDIAQFPNSIRKTADAGTSTLSFRIQFPFANDVCYVAHCYPYTWTRLQRHLFSLEKMDPGKRIMQRELLCSSLAGNRIDLLTITNFSSSESDHRKKKGVVLTSRVHPGEPGASWIIEGLIRYLMSDAPRVVKLRDSCVFKIVPMLNPDGVINGNYRCSLSGNDLNRQWKTPHAFNHRPIYAIKEVIRNFSAEREIVFFCDMHGHSRKKNVFLYGCETNVGPSKFKERIFPLMLSQMCDVFSWADSHFHVRKEKETCGRVVCFREFRIQNSFTLEASFAGSHIGAVAGCHFTIEEYQIMGTKFVDTLASYFQSLERGGDGPINVLYAKLLACFEDGTLQTEDEKRKKKKKKATKTPS